MDNPAPGSTEHGKTRERAEPGNSKIVVVDVGELQSEAQVGDLRAGHGTLVNRIERIVDDLIDAGTLKSGAQTVVVVVREAAPFSFGAFSSQEEDPYD
jgi:hypothetical protein